MRRPYLLRCTLCFPLVILTIFHLLTITYSTLDFLKQTQIHSGEINDIQFASDYSIFATVSSSDNKFIMWNTKTVSKISQKTLLSTINGIGINKAASQVIVLLKNGQIEIYDLASLNLKGSYVYPNSGYGVQISFISGGQVYIMGGFDQGLAPQLHFFYKNHTFIGSMPTTFNVGSQIQIIYNVNSAIIFVISNQSTSPVGIEMYTPDGAGNYVLTKKFMDSNAKVKAISISSDGSHLFTVSQDLTLRNYTLSPFNNMFEVTSVVYYGSNPLSVNGLVDVVTFVSTPTQIIEYFRTGEVSLETHYPTSNPITIIINLYPKLVCFTQNGKMIVYSISFFDGLDKDMTKWVVLSSVMGSVVLVLLLGLILEIRYNRIKESLKEEQGQGFKGNDV